jgi:hypothetical protein
MDGRTGNSKCKGEIRDLRLRDSQSAVSHFAQDDNVKQTTTEQTRAKQATANTGNSERTTAEQSCDCGF